MKDRSRYVFGAALAGVALGGVPGVVERANAGSITNADFTFESSYSAVFGGTLTSGSATAGAMEGAFVAESGTGSAYGFHSSTSTYSVPSGNGSAHALSSNDFNVGDYYQFTVPTTGIMNIMLTFDQVSSSTGPADFTLYASTDGTNYSSVSTYSIFASVSSTGTATAAGPITVTTSAFVSFASGTSNTAFSQSFDLSSLTGLNGDASAAFRLVDSAASALNTATVIGTSGTDRVDNFVVSGSAVASTPEPASLALVGVAAAGLLGRRRHGLS